MTQSDAVPERRATLDGFDEHVVNVEQRQLRYLERGNGDLLLVVHGGSGWTGNLSPAHIALARDYRVVAPELPGFGTTSGAGIESLRDLSAVVAELAVVLGHERYSLLGTSIGAAVALWVAIDNPDAVEKLILDAPAAFREGAPPPGPPPGGGPGPDRAMLNFMRQVVGPPTDPVLVAAMPACNVPTLVMFGQDDNFFPPRYAAEYTRLPRANVAIVYAAGHDIKGSRPDAYLATVEDFLRRGPGFVVADKSSLIHA